ncbi:hypothetical protein HK103_007611 [Boothiomyces macroporosus]|uniref:ABC transporter domain-containing protein n=1 Tax=Boothiomyces macroporosus TaxID=261099 RepID=A0AAD5Y3U7_9FUNG|nr:hypothetical protein HK103_007611 [Boothiomyces macroporosus]
MFAGANIYDDGRLTCPTGFWCPNTTSSDPATSPRICPPSFLCSLERLEGAGCATSQGPLEPQICARGYFCGNGSTKSICPQGYYCPLGSVNPIKCSSTSLCAEGSETPFELDGVIACVIVDIFLFAVFLYYKLAFRRQNPKPQINPDKQVPVLTPEGLAIPVQSDLDLLVDGFHKGLNGRNIQMEFKFENLGLKLKGGKVVLQGVSGSIKSARMTAIMGPSGAGKTTFMNVLCGKVPRTDGKLYVSGKEAEITDFKKMIGYVPQEDVMIRTLTVREILTHAARIRLPRSWSDVEVSKYVDALLLVLNLAHVQDSIIGDETRRGVSGGQRKRVNIGIELAAVPVCIFLDEPTSGLDSTSALEVCETLRKITRLGLTTVAVIHQPRVEIFDKFDDILMIAPGGRTAYLGPVSGVQAYYQELGYVFDPQANPADVLMDILSGKGINTKKVYKSSELADIWEKRPSVEETVQKTDFHEEVPKLIKERGANIFYQILYCHHRGLIQQLANPGSFALEIFLSSLAGAVMGFAIGGPTIYTGVYIIPMTPISPAPLEWLLALLGFLIAVTSSLAAGPAAVKIFSEEKPVFWREASAGHSTLGYYIGKTISSFYRLAICSLHFTMFLHILPNPLISFWHFYWIIFGTYFGIYGLSAVISFLVEREDASLMAVVICLLHGITAGFGITLVTARDGHFGWLFDMSYNRWLTEAMFNDGVQPFVNIFEIQWTADAFGYTLGRFNFDVGIAFLIGFIWRVLGYAVMMVTNRDRRR